MKSIIAERGFVTIATGNDRYYDLALNLLHSYRFHTKEPYPFAILCDRANRKTDDFDNVIVIEKPSFSYNDKLQLIDYLPFQETIFIDADSLAYSDLNKWFDLFGEQGDFSCYGFAFKDLSTNNGWFSLHGMGKYKESISFIPSFNGGVYYLRNTETCKKVFSIAKECARDYHNYSFRGFKEAADEPVLALGMSVCGCEPLNKQEIIFAPSKNSLFLNIAVGQALNKNNGRNYSLIHWSNYRTLQSDYQLEARRLKYAYRNNTRHFLQKLLYQYGLAKSYLWLCDLNAVIFRIRRYIRKRLKKK